MNEEIHEQVMAARKQMHFYKSLLFDAWDALRGQQKGLKRQRRLIHRLRAGQGTVAPQIRLEGAERTLPTDRIRTADEDLVMILRSFASAYPVDVFRPLTLEESEPHASLITRASAQMGRHFGLTFLRAANRIEELERLLEDLQERVDNYRAITPQADE